MSTQFAIPEDDFFDAYQPRINEADGTHLFSFDDVREVNLHNVWSVVDSDSGALYALPGFHTVNHVGYVVTEKPWIDGTEQAEYAAAVEAD